MKVRTTYHGDEADDIRSYLHSKTTDEVNKDYLNFYSRDFSEISLAKDFEYTDDTAANVIVGSEEYLVKNFWTLDGKNKTASVYPSVLATYLKKPDTRVRTMPLAISHPRNISQTIKVRLPEDWDVADSQAAIESEAFKFQRSQFYADRVITLRYHYVTKAAFVGVKAVADHIDKIDAVLDDSGLTIYKPLRTSTSHEASAYVMAFVLIAVVLYFNRKRVSR